MSLAFTVRAVLFDLDGVLVNSQSAIDGVWARWTERHGLAHDHVLPHIHGRRSVEIVQRYAPGADLDTEVRWLLQAEIDSAAGLRAYPGAARLLALLGPSEWAVVTSGARALATARLTSAALPIPRVFVTADDVRHGKPDPEGYLRAAELLGVPIADCAVIEDAPAGVAAGRAAGAVVVGVATTMPAETLSSAHLVLPSLAQLSAARDASGLLTLAERRTAAE